MQLIIVQDSIKKIEGTNRGSLDHFVGAPVHVTVQTKYDIKYITLRLSRYTNIPPHKFSIPFSTLWNIYFVIPMKLECTP